MTKKLSGFTEMVLLQTKRVALSVLTLFALLSSSADAAELWFYEWRQPPSLTGELPSLASLPEGARRWLVMEFDDDPYLGQLRALRQLSDAHRLSLLFKRSPTALLAPEYLELARLLHARGIETQFKFIGTLPTADEAGALKPLCEAGAKIFYITNQIPTAYESANLQLLKGCLDLTFALGRYPRYHDLKDFKPLEGLALGFVNNYFPAYAHVDLLNILGNPLSLRMTDSVPDLSQIEVLNLATKLISTHWDVQLFPTAEQYELFQKLDRGKGSRKLGLRWAFAPPRGSDIDAWIRMSPDRLQVTLETFERPGVREKLQGIRGEVVVETFDLNAAVRPELMAR